MIYLLSIAVLFVAYVNGANDNFKGVATLYGGRVLSYRSALSWAVITTFAGSIVSFFVGTKLLKLFSGQGIVDASVLSNPAFLASLALGAALTVTIATVMGMPISTTHSLVGALIGTGIASKGLISLSTLGKFFFLPLLAGPLSAIVLTSVVYGILHVVRIRLGIESSSFCLCVGDRQEAVVRDAGSIVHHASGLKVALEDEQYCRRIYQGKFIGLNIQKIINAFHILSSGLVSFARGLNDAPKIAALMMIVYFLSPGTGVLMIGITMAIGGLLHSYKIAQRMSFDVTEMNPGQAFTGNFVTASLVILGSLMGFPLSTTHVSCGSIFGIGLVNREANIRTILQIITAWVTTLPLAALLSALTWYILGKS